MKKILLIILDGLGDRVYKELDWKTPLEYANTPILDKLALKSSCGMMYALDTSLRPSSDVAHMALFGVNYKEYYTGRGPIELYGLGKNMSTGDLAFRGNFAIKDKNGIIVDRRAKRGTPSTSFLNKTRLIEIDGVKFKLYHIAEHRFALLVQGSNLDCHISDSDPHIEGVPFRLIEPLSKEQSSIFTAKVLNKYIDMINSFLDNSSDQANCILVRGGGFKPKWFDFSERYGLSAACITNNALYNGIGYLLGMKVMLPVRFTNYKEYYYNIRNLVKQALNANDFVFLHIQETDLCGEDGDLFGKVKVIELIDKTLSFLLSLDDEIVIAVTSDHSTPCVLKAHSGDSVPIMIYGWQLRYDNVSHFCENECFRGALGIIKGNDLMNILINSIGQASLIGG